jgi:HEAT repeat protein
LRERLQGTQNDLQAAVYVLDALARAGARVPLAELQWFVANPSLARSLYPLLGNTADPRVLPILLEAIASAPEGNRHAAILALDILVHDTSAHDELGVMLRKHHRAHERLVHSLDAESDAVVASAIVLLATTHDPTLAPRFLAAAACRTIVETAVIAVLELGRAVTKHLLREVDRVGVEARVLYLETLENLADPAAVKDLLELARGPEVRSAEAAMRALGAFGDASVVEPLVALGRGEDPDLARQAIFALVAVALRHPDEVAGAVRKLVDEGDWRGGWLTVLGAIGRNADIDVLVSGARHTDAEVRRAALDAAATFADRFPRQTLVFALTDEHLDVRAAAARALGSHRGEEVVSALIAACTDPVEQVVASALRSLGAVGGERAVQTLLTAVGATASPIAIAALQSLFVLAPPELEDAVRIGVRHIDPEVVREAIDVTLRLSAATARPHLITALAHPSWNVRRAAAESLVNRALFLPLDVLSERLRSETEPLVRDELERLSRVSERA